MAGARTLSRIIGVIRSADRMWHTVSVSRWIYTVLYSANLTLLIEGDGLYSHLCAGDTQSCGSCSQSVLLELQEMISKCIDVVADWMSLDSS